MKHKQHDRRSITVPCVILLCTSMLSLFIVLPSRTYAGMPPPVPITSEPVLDCVQAGISAASSPQDTIHVAVLDLDALDVPPALVQSITERLRFYMGEYPHILVLERTRMEDLFEELSIQVSGAVGDDSRAAQIGQMLGVQKMIVGSVSYVGNEYSLQVRMVDITTSSIDKHAFVDVASIEQVLKKATRNAAHQLVGAGYRARKSPFLAGTLSCLVPGTGQLYAGRTGSGIAYLLMAAAGGLYTGLKYGDYNSRLDDYQELINSVGQSASASARLGLYREIESQYEDLNDRKKELKILATGLSVIWVVNALDALLFTPRNPVPEPQGRQSSIQVSLDTNTVRFQIVRSIRPY